MSVSSMTPARAGWSNRGPRPDIRPGERVGPSRWKDRRLVVGVVLVALSVLIGSRLLAGADDRVQIWSLRTSLPAGATITADDLTPIPVALGGATGTYVAVADPTTDPVGKRLLAPVGAGALLPAGALASAEQTDGPRREITLAVQPLHAPVDLGRGDRVDVHVSTEGSAATASTTTVVLRDALVADVSGDDGSFGGTGELGVVLDVALTDADRVVAALRTGAVDLVRVPAGESTS